MANTFATCLTFTLQQEGGWSNDPNDAGGCTMQGITLPSYREWRQNPYLTCGDLYRVSPTEVREFYHAQYWLRTKAEQLPLGIDLMVMDAAVNMGVSRSIKLLQSALHIVTDGVIGPATLNATLAKIPAVLLETINLAHAAFYRSLNDFDIFGRGWMNRVAARKQAAIHLMQVINPASSVIT